MLGELPDRLGLVRDERGRGAEQALVPALRRLVIADTGPGEQVGRGGRAAVREREVVTVSLAALVQLPEAGERRSVFAQLSFGALSEPGASRSSVSRVPSNPIS